MRLYYPENYMQRDLLPVHMQNIYLSFPKCSILEVAKHLTIHTQFPFPFSLDIIEPPGIILGKMMAVFRN